MFEVRLFGVDFFEAIWYYLDVVNNQLLAIKIGIIKIVCFFKNILLEVEIMERFRIFISQFVSSIVVAVLVIRFCRSTIIRANLLNIFSTYRFNSIHIVLLIGLLTIAILAVKVILWLMRRPMTEREIEEAEMGTVENIPAEK